MADEQTTPPADKPAEKTFTQADLDRIVKERVERERGKYADYDDLKKAAERLKSLEDSQKTESQKLLERLTAIESQLGLKDQTIKDLEGKLTAKTREQLAGSVAARLGAHDPTDANILAAISAIDPAGANAPAEIEAALSELQKAKPYLFKQQADGQPTTPKLGGFNPGVSSGAAETDQQVVKRLMGSIGIGAYGPLGR